MAGIGEASAIVGLIATAAQLSKAVVDIASKYKDARKQIESFGHEVATLGTILDQMYRLLGKDHLERDIEIYSVLVTIVNQCSEFFSELEVYKDALYSRQGPLRNLSFRGKSKWVFEAAELEYLRARVESMKTNMLLMMTMQCTYSLDRFESSSRLTQQTVREIHLLALQSNACVRRLETLEEEITLPSKTHSNAANNRVSIMTTDTATSARSMRDSIMSLYGHRSYYQIILDPREGEFEMAPEVQVDHSRISMIIENHLQPMDTTKSSNIPGSEDLDTDIERLAEEQRYDELDETEATNNLWNTVYMHNKTRHSVPSEESAPSTVKTRASNIISIAYIPGVTKESITDMQGPLLYDLGVTKTSLTDPFLDKPLPRLPPTQGVNHTQIFESNVEYIEYPYRAKAIYSLKANPDDPSELSFHKNEILAIRSVKGRWWDAKSQLGDTGIVPSNYLIFL